ncbi:GntR family transcriptional regulator [Actinomadura craniellae]|uniref:GntR family transcriptional regulator n=1 Tax=Actinomadura craniellae TaxID=2231787 RepID=A0A365HAY2_9ACTN|nr:GntR family transcriptional regulator [Actinomadura craniellae]RAY16257.1 GntR family transcriptional regulator [Actinomadura craniellae]
MRRQEAVPDLPAPVVAGAGAAAASPHDPVLTLPGEGLTRMSSGEQVRLYVRRLIFDGVLRQGQRVPQDAIAQTLGVSRIPVREAMIALERESWVTIIPHRGVFVNALDEAAVHDHYALYGLFYGFAVQRATERQGAALAKRLAAVQKRLAAAVGAEGDAEELHTTTLEFHRVVVDAANSPRLRSMLRQMTGIVPGNFFELVPGAAKVEKQGTAAIVRAVRRGDAKGAAEEYSAMLEKQGDLVVDLFTKKGMFENVG